MDMFDVSGHALIIRSPRGTLPDGRVHPNPDPEMVEMEANGISVTDISMAVFGQDLGEIMLLAFDHKGDLVYRAEDVDSVVLANFEAGARTINAAFRMEHEQAVKQG